jgi:hypothetical protein
VPAEWLVNYAVTDLEAGLNQDKSTNLYVATMGIRMPATQITFPDRMLSLRCMTRLGSQQWEQQCWTLLIHHKVPGPGESPFIQINKLLLTAAISHK